MAFGPLGQESEQANFQRSNTQCVVLKFQINWCIITVPKTGKTEPNELTSLQGKHFPALGTSYIYLLQIDWFIVLFLSAVTDQSDNSTLDRKPALCNIFFVTQHRT